MPVRRRSPAAMVVTPTMVGGVHTASSLLRIGSWLRLRARILCSLSGGPHGGLQSDEHMAPMTASHLPTPQPTSLGWVGVQSLTRPRTPPYYRGTPDFRLVSNLIISTDARTSRTTRNTQRVYAYTQPHRTIVHEYERIEYLHHYADATTRRRRKPQRPTPRARAVHGS